MKHTTDKDHIYDSFGLADSYFCFMYYFNWLANISGFVDEPGTKKQFFLFPFLTKLVANSYSASAFSSYFLVSSSDI